MGATSMALLLMLVLHTTSGLVKMWSGNPRATINSVWQWIGYGLMFWMIRQLIRSERESRALCAVMIGLAGFSAIHGCYESFYSLPRDQEIYESSNEAERLEIHQQAGLEPLPVGTPGRVHFDSRLQATEPTAGFALTNSLAAFLTPWLVLVLGIFLTPWLGVGEGVGVQTVSGRRPGQGYTVILTAALGTVVIGLCLILTKSRSAYLATAVGVALLLGTGKVGLGVRPRRRSPRWLLVAGFIMVVIAVGVNRFDPALFGEAFKSLGYRIEYWRSTLGMIMANPLVGCGPGNFQQYFAQFKLPQTSETVADPHNLFLEIWATAGTGTLLAACWLIWTFCRQSARDEQPVQDVSVKNQDVTVMPVYLGAIAGATLPILLVSSHELFLLVPFVLVVFGVNQLHPWVQRGHLSPALVKIALLAWMVSLLVSGGIGIPGVAVTGWLLMAVALPVGNFEKPGERRVTGSTLAAWALMTLLFYFSGLLPLYRAERSLEAGDKAYAQAQQELRKYVQAEQETKKKRMEKAEQSWEGARIAWLDATESDPYTSKPWIRLTQLYWQRWKFRQLDTDYEQMGRAAEQVIRHNRRSYVIQTMIGDWHLAAYQAPYPERLDNAMQAYLEAQRLYPKSAIIAARLAWIYHMKGEGKKSLEQVKLALKWDQLNPHMEFKLGLRYLFDSPSLESSSNLRLTNAKQAMENLKQRYLQPDERH